MSRALVLACLAAALLSGTAACRRPATGPLFPAPMGGRWGFIDREGRTAVPARFDGAGAFSEGRAPVEVNGRWGYADASGALVVPALHRSAGRFRAGLAIADSGLSDRPFGILDSKGAWAVPPSFRSLQPGDDAGRLFLGQADPGGHVAFYDRAGERVFGPFVMAFPFSEGFSRVEEAGGGVLDSSGTVTLRGTVFESVRFSEGVIAVRRDGKLGYMDPDGDLAVEARWDEGGDFREGLAPVREGNSWFFIDHAGKVAAKLPENVRHAMPLSEGRSLVTADRDTPGRKLGYVDRAGRWAVPPAWDDAEPFSEGLARVGEWRTNTFAYIDPEGRVVWRGTAP